MPVQSDMGTVADQFKDSVPLKVSLAASNASQSDTRSWLLSGFGTAPSVAHGLVRAPGVVAEAMLETGPVPIELISETR